ncbi:MAG TPA: PAS domain-containing sensor histidine kinase [Candidatus Nitrosotenuis sp.]|nr:PAS domain-containing sensor histidine kinase [Candidatus Nitrosotenuis sp.]
MTSNPEGTNDARSDNVSFDIFEYLPEMYREINVDGIITNCNNAYAEKLGYTKEEVIGKSLFDHIPQSQKESMTTSFEAWQKTGIVKRRKISMQRKDGTTFEVLLNSTSTFDETGKLSGSKAILKDISGLADMQTKIRKIEYESLYQGSPDMYRTVNPEGIIVDCNNAYAEKLGYTKEEVIGSNLLQHTAEQSASVMTQNMENWLKTGQINTTEIWMKKRDGSTFPALLTPTNLFDEFGKLVGRNVVIKDISELHQTKKLVKELEDVDRLKEEFLSMITHELKSPLTPIIGFSQVLRKPNMLGPLNAKQLDAVETILSNATRLKKLIGDLLDAQKLDLGKMKFESNEIAVDDLLERIASSFRYTLKEKNIEFENHCTGKFTIKSDRDRIEQVLTNLIYNAIDFVPKQTGKIAVNAVPAGDGSVTFSVADNGVGIPLEKQENLFQKFYQVNTSHDRRHGGSGLGLSICKGIVEGLGGKIWVSSKEGTGSTFYFTLPKEKM